jgi:hypothetical protein
VGSGADEQQRRAAMTDNEQGRATRQPAIASSPPIPPAVRWRESAHEYDFGPAEAEQETTPQRRWRGSAHEYDFGGEW